MILYDDCKLIGNFAAFTSTKLDNVVVVIHFLAFNFKLAFFVVVFEVDEEADNAGEKK